MAWSEAQASRQFRANLDIIKQISQETVEESRQRWHHVPEDKLHSPWFVQLTIDVSTLTEVVVDQREAPWVLQQFLE